MALFPIKFDTATIVTYVFIIGVVVFVIFAIWTMVFKRDPETYAQSVGPPPPDKPTLVDVADSKPASVQGTTLESSEDPAGVDTPSLDNEYKMRFRVPVTAPSLRPPEIGLHPDQVPLIHSPSLVESGSGAVSHVDFESAPGRRPVIPISSKQFDSLYEALDIETKMDREELNAEIESMPIQPLMELNRLTIRPESAQYTQPRNRDTGSAHYEQRYPFEVKLGAKYQPGRRGRESILRAMDRIREDLSRKFSDVYIQLGGNPVDLNGCFEQMRDTVLSDIQEWSDLRPPANVTTYVMKQADNLFDDLVLLFTRIGASIDFDGTVAAKKGLRINRQIPAVPPEFQDLRIMSNNPESIEVDVNRLIDRTYDQIAEKHRLRSNSELELVIKMAGKRVWDEYDSVHHQNFPPEVLVGLYKSIPNAMEKVLLM